MRSTCEPQGLPLQWGMQHVHILSPGSYLSGGFGGFSLERCTSIIWVTGSTFQHLCSAQEQGSCCPCDLKSWITWAACQLWHRLWAPENCTTHFQLYVMDTSWSFPGVKTAMSHKCMSQSSSQHDLVVLDLKPLGFPEAVRSPSSAESELLLSCSSEHTVLSLGQGSCWCIILGCFVSLWWVSLQLDSVAGRNEVASDKLCSQSYWGLVIFRVTEAWIYINTINTFFFIFKIFYLFIFACLTLKCIHKVWFRLM